MAEKKLRVVHYLNQYFGQVGGEEKATAGFTVKAGPVGPGLALQKEMGDRAEIVATVICGESQPHQKHRVAGLAGRQVLATPPGDGTGHAQEHEDPACTHWYVHGACPASRAARHPPRFAHRPLRPIPTAM